MERRFVKSFQTLGAEAFGPDFNTNEYVAQFAMQKALSSGGIVNPVNAGIGDAGAALRLENLDATMTSVLIKRQDFKLFNWIERIPTTQSLYQWNRRNSYGKVRGIAGFVEGGGPVGTSAQFTRNAAQMKYMGVRRGVTHQFALMGDRGGTMVDPVAEENMDGTMELLEKIERGLVWSDSTIHDETGGLVEYDGLIKQILGGGFTSTNVIDLRGDYANFTMFDGIAENLRTTGKVTNFDNVQAFVTPNTRKSLSEALRGGMRFNVDNNAAPYTYNPGTKIDTFTTNFGDIPLQDSILLDAVPGGHPIAAAYGGDPLSPAQPAAPTATVGAPAGGNVSQWGPNSAVVQYYVSSFNSYGESLPVACATTTTVASGQEVVLAIPRVSGAIGYRVYRNDDLTLTADQAGYIGLITQPASGNASFTDDNAWLPNTDIGLVLERDPENMVIAQLLPLIKWPIAITSTTVEFFILLYHTLVVKAPERQHLIKNIGRLKDY